LKIEVKKKIDVIFDCRTAQRPPESHFRVETQSSNWKKYIWTMRNRLDVSGFEPCKKNFNHAQFHARMKISATVKMVRWYLGN
jgi:hypothetical protein